MNSKSEAIKCPECKSTHVNKNGRKAGKQNHICIDCGRQFIEGYEAQRGYSEEVKRECLTMYVNGMGFRAIERIKGVHHTSIINWVKQVGELLANAYTSGTIPPVGELDELETFVGSKKQDLGGNKREEASPLFCLLWTAVNHFQHGAGDPPSQEF